MLKVGDIVTQNEDFRQLHPEVPIFHAEILMIVDHGSCGYIGSGKPPKDIIWVTVDRDVGLPYFKNRYPQEYFKLDIMEDK